MTDEVCEVVVTAPDADWLAEFTRGLVADRLAACGHNFKVIRSIYRWQGEVHDQEEARVGLHTRATLVPQIVERTKRDHPYEVACVIALPIVDGSSDYVRWILDETNPS